MVLTLMLEHFLALLNIISESETELLTLLDKFRLTKSQSQTFSEMRSKELEKVYLAHVPG